MCSSDLLAAANVVQGKSCMSYPAVKPEIEAAGGTWICQNDTFSDAHADGNLVTASAWPAHPAWMRKFLEVIGTRIEA